MGNEMHEEFTLVSSLICNELFSIIEDSFRTRRNVSICKLFGRYQDPEREFSQLRAHSYTKKDEFKGG